MDSPQLNPLSIRATQSLHPKQPLYSLSQIFGIGLKKRRVLLLLLLIALLVSGCDSSPSDAEVMKIFAAIAVSSAFVDRKKKVDTEFTHFVKHRIRGIIAANSSFDHPPHYESLVVRISAEIDKVLSIVNDKIGTDAAPGPFGGAKDTATPAHTDLTDIARLYVDDGDSTIADRQQKFVADRRQRVRRIIWRALAVHGDLWTNPSSVGDVGIHMPALEELLNRRLRFVERMLYTDSVQGDRNFPYTISGAQGPWTDGKRTVMFEYPFISLGSSNDTTSFLHGLTAGGLTASSLEPDFHAAAPPREEIRYKVGAGRIRPAASANWTLSNPTSYVWTMNLGGKTPSQLLDVLIPSVSPVSADFQNIWERNWIFCDHMVSVLEVDALRFGLARRTGSDNEFNGAADDGVTLHAIIPLTGNPKPKSLMDNGEDYFEGVAIAASDLQVGDLVIIWNHFFFRSSALFPTDFGLENSIITDAFGENPADTKLTGHGAKEDKYGKFVGDLVGVMDGFLKGLREAITLKVNAAYPNQQYDYLNTGVSITITNPFHGELVFWNPFNKSFTPADGLQQLGVPGAWWIRVRLDALAMDLTTALTLLPKSVSVDTTIHSPPKALDNAADDFKESVYIPLSQPKGIRGGWVQYFDDVKKNKRQPKDTELEDAKTDATWAPGYQYGGPTAKIPVLRPKVRT